MALSASSMVIASPPRSRCPARRTGGSDVRDIGQPVLAEVDSRTSRAEASSVTDETAAAQPLRSRTTSLGPTNVRPFSGRLAIVLSQAQSWLAVMSTLLGLYSAVIGVNGGAAIGELRGGLAWRISALFLAFLAYSLAFVAVVWGARSTFGPSAVCLARSPGSGIRGNRGNRDRC
jgi:hypothetical protein